MIYLIDPTYSQLKPPFQTLVTQAFLEFNSHCFVVTAKKMSESVSRMVVFPVFPLNFP